MNWISKKIILSQIKKYFIIESDDQVDIEITGKRRMKCSNLKLKQEVINSKSLPVKFQHLFIKELHLSYGSSQQEPLKVLVEGITVVIKFNPNQQRKPPEYSNNIQNIKDFTETIESKEGLHHKGFMGQEIFQLKKMFEEALISNISLVVRKVLLKQIQVDISLQYQSEGQSRVFGVELGEVNIKQRVVISHSLKSNEKIQEQEVLCTLEDVNVYLGISSEESKIQSKAKNKQILHKIRTIKKIYLLQRNRIELYYNLQKKTVAVQISEIKLKISKLTIIEIIKIVGYLNRNLSTRPILRPGQGEMKSISDGKKNWKMKDGTLKWWDYTLSSVIEKILQRKKNNFFANHQYHKYLYFLFYKYTFGANKYVSDQIEQYQKKKLARTTMEIYFNILSRIQLIRDTKKHKLQQQDNFVKFLQCSPRIKKLQLQHNLKKISYSDIKNSKIYFNLENCQAYIRGNQFKNNLNMKISLDTIKIAIVENKFDSALIDEGFKLPPNIFYSLKSKYINRYYKNTIQHPNQGEKNILLIELSRIQLIKSRIQLKLLLPSILIHEECNQLILKIRQLIILKQNNSIFNERNKVILEQKGRYFKVKSIFINIQQVTVRHLLTIWLMMNGDITMIKTEQQQFQQYFYNNVYKKLSMHPSLQSHSGQKTNIQCENITIVSALFTQNQYLTISCGGVNYNEPSNVKPRILIKKISVNRSRINNINRIKNNSFQKLQTQRLSTLLENNKPVIIILEKIMRQHFVNLQQKQKNAAFVVEEEYDNEKTFPDLIKNNKKFTIKQKALSNKKDIGYIYFQNVVDIVIPFLLVQLSFLDLLYMQVMLNYWKQTTTNPYFFPKKKSSQQKDQQFEGLSDKTIKYLQHQHQFTRSGRSRCKLQGIQIILYGQSMCLPENRMASLMMEGILFQDKNYVLGRDTTISLLNIYIENCLGNRIFNSRRLYQMLQKPNNNGQPLIYPAHGEMDNMLQSHLILYGVANESKQRQLMKCKINTQLDIIKLSKKMNIQINVNAVFLYQSPQFFEIITHSFKAIENTAKSKCNIQKSIQIEQQQKQEEYEILQMKRITESRQINGHIDKLNVIVIYQANPVYTISFLNIKIKHISELFVGKYHFLTDEIYVVDISINCGLHPIVFKSKEMNCYLTLYQSQLLKKKQKKSALVDIHIANPQIYFLNRKIMELVNFIMSHFNSSRQEESKADCKQDDKVRSDQNKYPFCYKVELYHPIFMLLRSSLSQQKLVGEAENMVIHNINDQKAHQINYHQTFLGEDLKQYSQQDSFQSCVEINQVELNFYPFKKEEQEMIKPNIINIYINDISFFSEHLINNAIINMPKIFITLINKQINALIESLSCNITQDSYQLLIRFTEQNFSEKPVSFPKNTVPSQQKFLDFKSKYKIDDVLLRFRQNKQSLIFGEMNIKQLAGTNFLFSNGEMQDEIYIESIYYTGSINNGLETIISKKQNISQKQKKNNLLFSDKIQRIIRQENFNNHEYFSECHENDDKKMNEFFSDNDDGNFKFDQHQIKRQQKDNSMLTEQLTHVEQQTNIDKAGKWLCGMCQKCLCCLKTKNSVQEQHRSEEKQLKKKISKQKKLEAELIPKLINQFRFFQSFIQLEQQIINFEKNVKPQQEHKNVRQENTVYIHIVTQKSKQKRIYILLQDLNIHYQRDKHILRLSNFLGKPYANPVKPHYVREANFNNFRPFETYIELVNSSVEMFHRDGDEARSIILDLNLTYRLEKLGDIVQGPGRKKMSVDVIFKIFFYSSEKQSDNNQQKEYKIPISNLLRLIWETEARKKQYHQPGPLSNQQKLLFCAISQQDQNAQKNSDENTSSKIYLQDEIKINLPISSLKQIKQLCQNIFMPKQDRKVSEQSNKKMINKKQQEEIKNSKNKDNQKNNNDLLDFQSKSNKIKFNSEIRSNQLKKNKSNQEKFINNKIQKDMNNIKQVQNDINKEKIKRINTIQSNKNIKLYFIPHMTIDVQTKIKTSYVKLFLNNVHYKILQCIKRPKMQANNQIINLQANINYLNLNIVKFEPFLQPSNFHINIQTYLTNNNEINKMVFISKAEKDENAKDYTRGLSLNLSTALFHTYKQLELKYQLANEDMQFWSEKCFNLTTKNTEVYEVILRKNNDQKQNWMKNQSLFQPQPSNIQLKNFFGKQFIVQNKGETSKKKSKRLQTLQKRFHYDGLKVFVYHSFLEPKTKLKNIIYRTPFAILNFVSEKIIIELNFKIKKYNYNDERWNHNLQFRQFYSIPADIYDQDFLISITTNKKTKPIESIIQKPSSMLNIKEQKLRETSNKQTVKYQKDMMISAKYLVQMHAKISQYSLLGSNKYSDYLFGNDCLKTRYIDKRDILIRSNNLTLAIINVKTQQNQEKNKNSDKIIFYDSLTIILSPIIIYNFTTNNLMVTSCRKNKPIIIPHGQKIEINQFPPGILVQDIAMEFSQDIVHHQYHFLDPNYKVDPKTKEVIKPLLIDRMQSLNLRIIKQTYNTCLIEIYPDWVINNKTQLQFQLGYLSNQFPIDKNNCSFLSIEQLRNENQPSMKIKLYDHENPKQDPHQFNAEIGLLDIFTLVKIQQECSTKNQQEKIKREKQKKIRMKKQEVYSNRNGCCFSSQQQKICYPTKKNDQNPFRCIQFVMSIRQSDLYSQTKEILLNYKYDITNSMDIDLDFYQASGKKHNQKLSFQEVLLYTLLPGENRYLFSYDFLPKYYFVSIKKDDQKYTSNLFNCEAATGGSFSLKLKPEKGIADILYLRVDINHIDHTSKLYFKLIDDNNRIKHPFRIENRTPYMIKITENQQSFKIKPNDSNPFVWSDLIDNTHQIRIEAEGVSKLYSLKQKSQFEPIILRGDNFRNHLRQQSKRMLFKKQTCKVKWSGISGQFLVIYDMFAKKLHIKGELKTASFDIDNIDKIEDKNNKLQIWFNNKNINLEFYPSQETKNQWYDIISKDIYNDVTDKIHFTIQSLQNSMIFFLHSVDISSDNNLKMNKKQYVIENLYISLISNNSKKVQQILLINMEDIEYSYEQKITKIKQSDGRQNFNVKRNEQCFQIKKLKINNQLLEAVNPVILSQIKKSKHPFLQFKRQKQHLIEDGNNEQSEQIDHYKSIIFFLDQAQLIVQASLFPKLMDLKKYIDQIQDNYKLQQPLKVKLSNIQHEGRQNQQRKQFYINLLEIKPIKMTVSVNFESQTAYYSSNLMNFLTMIPAGVENAIIQIDSYIFHHVFLEEQLIKKTLNEYYLSEMKKQIIYNTGSIQFLAPLQLIQGLGVGVKNIFYNPFYELVSKQEVQSFASALIQAFISLAIYLFTKGFYFISIIFKLIAFLSFDRTFQSKRQMFRKQIFKSPIDGFNYGGRQFLRIFKQFFVKFCQWPCKYNTIIPVLGLIFGIILSISNIFPWFIKLNVSFFDFIYVIGLGLINWGYYEQNSMKQRSRPIRTFPYNQLRVYDYLTAKGNEIMRKNQIQRNDSQSCSYVGYIEEQNDESKYLVLSNYRILYCNYQLLSFKQVQLYKIASAIVIYNGKDNKNEQKFILVINLNFPDKQKYICIETNVDNYQIKFNNIRKMKKFLSKMIENMKNQHLHFQIDTFAVEQYQKVNNRIIES